jgi:hypothetical protein
VSTPGRPVPDRSPIPAGHAKPVNPGTVLPDPQKSGVVTPVRVHVPKRWSNPPPGPVPTGRLFLPPFQRRVPPASS